MRLCRRRPEARESKSATETCEPPLPNSGRLAQSSGPVPHRNAMSGGLCRRLSASLCGLVPRLAPARPPGGCLRRTGLRRPRISKLLCSAARRAPARGPSISDGERLQERARHEACETKAKEGERVCRRRIWPGGRLRVARLPQRLHREVAEGPGPCDGRRAQRRRARLRCDRGPSRRHNDRRAQRRRTEDSAAQRR